MNGNDQINLLENNKKFYIQKSFINCTEGRTRTGTGLPPHAPQACVSTNSTTSAINILIIHHPNQVSLPPPAGIELVGIKFSRLSAASFTKDESQHHFY